MDGLEARKYQQPSELVREASMSGISHGAIVRADVEGVHISPTNIGGTTIPKNVSRKSRLFFCHIRKIKVQEKLQAGDGGEISQRVLLDWRLCRILSRQPQLQPLILKDVLISTNGKTAIIFDERSSIERLPLPAGAVV